MCAQQMMHLTGQQEFMSAQKNQMEYKYKFRFGFGLGTRKHNFQLVCFQLVLNFWIADLASLSISLPGNCLNKHGAAAAIKKDRIKLGENR